MYVRHVRLCVLVCLCVCFCVALWWLRLLRWRTNVLSVSTGHMRRCYSVLLSERCPFHFFGGHRFFSAEFLHASFCVLTLRFSHCHFVVVPVVVEGLLAEHARPRLCAVVFTTPASPFPFCAFVSVHLFYVCLIESLQCLAFVKDRLLFKIRKIRASPYTRSGTSVS